VLGLADGVFVNQYDDLAFVNVALPFGNSLRERIVGGVDLGVGQTGRFQSGRENCAAITFFFSVKRGAMDQAVPFG
jgi:hypothetical protein